PTTCSWSDPGVRERPRASTRQLDRAAVDAMVGASSVRPDATSVVAVDLRGRLCRAGERIADRPESGILRFMDTRPGHRRLPRHDQPPAARAVCTEGPRNAARRGPGGRLLFLPLP